MAEIQSGWHYRLSPRLVLRTPGPVQEEDPGARVLQIHSGGAFPPGHPTTRLCLDLLRELLTAHPVQGLLDVGSGAGVLTLAAAALGVARVVAVDIAAAAARATWQNVRANGLADSVRVAQGSTGCLKPPFDLVAANLPWEVQMEMAPELHRLAAASGRLLLSGFRDNQEAPLQDRYLSCGRSLRRRVVKPFHHPELPPDISFTWVAWLLA